MNRLFPCLLLLLCASVVLATDPRHPLDQTRLELLKPKPDLSRQAASPITLPRLEVVMEDAGVTNFPADFPANITWAFTVVERQPGAHGGPLSYGLERSYDDGRTWTRWVKWVNDTFAYNFEQRVTLPATGPNNQLIRVRTWASNQP